MLEKFSPQPCDDGEPALPVTPEKRDLISHLAAYTGEIVSTAKTYDPTKVTRYVTP